MKEQRRSTGIRDPPRVHGTGQLQGVVESVKVVGMELAY